MLYTCYLQRNNQVRIEWNQHVTEIWIERCIFDNELHEINASVVYQPLANYPKPITEMRSLKIGLTGFRGIEQEHIIMLIKYLGNYISYTLIVLTVSKVPSMINSSIPRLLTFCVLALIAKNSRQLKVGNVELKQFLVHGFIRLRKQCVLLRIGVIAIMLSRARLFLR